MVKIRLARVGKRGHATFRVVITEHSRPPKSGAREVVGSYDPHTHQVKLAVERIRHYLAAGAQPSPTVHNLLVDEHVVDGPKVAARRYPPTVPTVPPPGSAPADETAAEPAPETPPS